MQFSLFKKIIDETKDYVELVDLDLYGESMLNPDIYKMIKYAKTNGLNTLLNTNATLLNKENSRKLIHSGLDILIISFDGTSKETYELIRREGNFIKSNEWFIKFT